MFFPKLTTSRIEVELQELKIKDVITLCEIPAHLNEAGIGESIKRIVKECNIPLGNLTVQERYAIICAYITAKEQKDWYASDDGLYSAFTLGIDASPEPYKFNFDGVDLYVHAMTGDYIEAVERLVVSGAIHREITPITWLIAAAAAQIRTEEPDNGTPDELVTARAAQLQDMPEDAFFALLDHFSVGLAHQKHLFNTWFAKDGIICLPREVGACNPARFCFDAMFSDRSRETFTLHD